MNGLAALAASPAFLLAIAAGVLVEAAVLIAWHRRTGRGPRPAATISFLGAGLCFLVALYLVRAQTAPSTAFVTALLLALLFHAWHLILLGRR
jgi:hypothetical protein